MRRRRNLKGVAAGMASAFISRYNDVDGYWGMGMIYHDLSIRCVHIFRLDLLTGHTLPALAYTSMMAKTYRQRLLRMIERHGLSLSQVSEARIEILFNTQQPMGAAVTDRRSHGDPFSCTAYIRDDLGHLWIFSQQGRCRRHDPRKEQRSTRRNTDFHEA